jgi:hypothetical protein
VFGRTKGAEMSFLNNPRHWRERAEETRTKAEQLWYNEESKQRMLRIADEYDRLADHAAERVRSTGVDENVLANRR